MTIVGVEVGTADTAAAVEVVAATTTITVALHVMMTASVALMDVVTTMAPAALTATPQVGAMIVTAAAGMIIVEVGVAGLMAETKGALQPTPTLPQGRPASRMAEVETMITVDRYSRQILRSAN